MRGVKEGSGRAIDDAVADDLRECTGIGDTTQNGGRNSWDIEKQNSETSGVNRLEIG